MRKIYIGCSLTHAPADFVAKIEKLKNELRRDYEVLDFIGTEKGTPADVYKSDIQKCIAGCDIFVAICDYPAIGLGYEMGTAIEKYSKPTLGLIKEGLKVSRLVLGINHPMYTLKYYNTIENIISLIKEKELQHFKPTTPFDVCESDVCKV